VSTPLRFDGQWYDGAGSGRTDVRVAWSDDGQLAVRRRADGGVICRIRPGELRISPRLANTTRYLQLADGPTIETLDNDAVDRLQQQQHPSRSRGLVHRLESHWRFVLLTLLLVGGLCGATLRYGVPAAADAVAAALPADLLDSTSQQTLELLDRRWLEPSALSAARQQALRQHFDALLHARPELRIRVLFRASAAIGANAFALPSGQIIFTDAMINLAHDDDELLAVLAHEVGHVVHRHALRRMVQSSLYLFGLALITGDTSGTAELVLGLPVLMAELAYSRAYETEADQYALAYLRATGIPPHRFADLMRRLEASRRGAASDATSADLDQSRWKGYLSTHPPTAERLRAFE